VRKSIGKKHPYDVSKPQSVAGTFESLSSAHQADPSGYYVRPYTKKLLEKAQKFYPNYSKWRNAPQLGRDLITDSIANFSTGKEVGALYAKHAESLASGNHKLDFARDLPGKYPHNLGVLQAQHSSSSFVGTAGHSHSLSSISQKLLPGGSGQQSPDSLLQHRPTSSGAGSSFGQVSSYGIQSDYAGGGVAPFEGDGGRADGDCSSPRQPEGHLSAGGSVVFSANSSVSHGQSDINLAAENVSNSIESMSMPSEVDDCLEPYWPENPWAGAEKTYSIEKVPSCVPRLNL